MDHPNPLSKSNIKVIERDQVLAGSLGAIFKPFCYLFEILGKFSSRMDKVLNISTLFAVKLLAQASDPLAGATQR
jgi:hypothetical protein